MGVNLRGVFHCVQAEINAMKEQELRRVSERNPNRGTVRGTIVNMGSLGSYNTIPGNSPYVISKHAVLGLTKNAGKLSDPCSARFADGNLSAKRSIRQSTTSASIASARLMWTHR